MNSITFTITLNSGATRCIRIRGNSEVVNIEAGNAFLEALAETGMLRIKPDEDDDSVLEVSEQGGKNYRRVDGLMIQGTDIAMIELRKGE